MLNVLNASTVQLRASWSQNPKLHKNADVVLKLFKNKTHIYIYIYIYICSLQETHFTPRDTYKLKVRGWNKISHAHGNQQKARVAILLSDKIDLKMKNILRDKEGHYIMIKGSTQEKDIAILNIYAPNIGSSQYMRQLLRT